jgi:hypothetical protein
MAAPMNTQVATKERNERRPKPHTPCPLVQPEPITVPTPTSKPATMSKGRGRCAIAGGESHAANSAPPTIKPARNAQRQAPSLGFSDNALEAIPLIPATLPSEAKSSQEAKKPSQSTGR